jgi:hypothetical protein
MAKTPTTEAKVAPDWERIEADFRAGIKSLREIAEPFEITEGAIRKRAKRDGWTKDLSAKIKARADDLVRKETVRTTSTQLTPETEKSEVEINARVAATVRLEHRTDIKRTRELFQGLMGEIEGMTAYPELAEELFELLNDPTEGADPDKPMSKGEEERHRRMRDTFNRIMSSAGRIDSAKKLTEMLEKVIRLERQAFSIEDEAGQPPVDPSNESPNQLARRVAFILAQGMKNKGA